MALKQRSAAWPWKEGVPTHIPLPSPVPRGFLLPGDPARVDMAAEVLGDFTIVGQNREFRMATGRYDGVTIGVCSTGIGGASTEIVMVELAALGVGHFVRTGGMGALADDLSLGDFLIADAALANSACARWYAPGSDLVKADRSLAERLDAARTGLGLGGRRGTCLTADGYYRAQGRPDRPAGAGNETVLDRIAERGADGIEMECEIVLAVGAALGVAAGGVLAVHAHRRSDGWLENYEETQRNVLRIGAQALARAIDAEDDPQRLLNKGELQ